MPGPSPKGAERSFLFLHYLGDRLKLGVDGQLGSYSRARMGREGKFQVRGRIVGSTWGQSSGSIWNPDHESVGD